MKELDFLGKEVTVKVDRPIRSEHPKFSFEYKLNYGFIPNTMAGDGHEIDAYIIGEENEIEEFVGIVKGVIIRFNDNENKLVVAKSEYNLTENEIREKTHFQEKYFDTKIIMKH